MAVVKQLLSFVPDVLRMEGSTACLLHPLPDETTAYTYGLDHAVLKSLFLTRRSEINRVQVTGYDPDTGREIIAEGYRWEDKLYERVRQTRDRNLKTRAATAARAEILLRKAEISTSGGELLVPVNCGQELYDIIEIFDNVTGLAGQRYRILGSELNYRAFSGLYSQKLILGKV